MDTLDTQTWIILAAVVALALIAAGAFFYRRKQSHGLQKHYGAEYDRTVVELGSRTKAESDSRRAKSASNGSILSRCRRRKRRDSLRPGKSYRPDSSTIPRVWLSKPSSWFGN